MFSRLKQLCATTALAGLAVGLAGGESAHAAGKALADHHPIVGTWRFDVPDHDCSEIYRIRADGTTLVTSGDELAESEFEIGDKPSAKGFYRMQDRIVRDNGRADCLGQMTTVGHQSTLYIRFNRSGEQLIICESESLKACFGPLVRVHDQEI